MNAKSLRQVTRALKAELSRSIKGLKSPGQPKPYHISYLFSESQGYATWGRYGSLWSSHRIRKRHVYADVRVGSHRFDQTTKGGLSDNSDEKESYDLVTLPMEDDTDALRFALWRLTDAKYREAVVAYHRRKSRHINYQDEDANFPSFQKTKARISLSRPKAMKIDTEYWDAYVRKTSKAFKKHPELQNTYVDFSAKTMTKVFVDTDGSHLVWQTNQISLSAHIWTLLDSGETLETDLVLSVNELDELPSAEEFQRSIEEKIATLHALGKGTRLTSYSGPVLLAPVPAGLFVHEVLGHRLEGNRMLSNEEGKTFRDKVGERITHPDLTIYDDPSKCRCFGQGLIGHFPFDDEGMPSQRATLVEGGVLCGMMTTRAPLLPMRHHSNGHARSEYHERPISRMGNLFVETREGLPWEELKALLIEEVKRQELPYGIILLECEGGETDTESYDFQAFLGEITVAKRIFPNGKEEFLRGVDFVGTPLASLANIVAIGDTYAVDNGYCTAESGTIPVSTVSPALLMSSLELQAKDMTRMTPYSLPVPWDKRRP